MTGLHHKYKFIISPLPAVLAPIHIHMQTIRKSKATSHESGFTVFKLKESLLISYPHKVNTSF